MHGNLYETIVQYRKSGDLAKALEHARYAMTKMRQSKSIKSAFAWSLYDLLKQYCKDIYKLNSYTDRHKIDQKLKDICIEYMHYKLPKNDLCYSLMLSQLARLNPPPICLVSFLKWGGPSGLRAEDRVVQQEGSKTYPSLLETVTLKVAELVLQSEDEVHAQFTLGLVNYTLRETQELQEKDRLQRAQGILLRLCKHDQKALQAHLSYIKSHQQDFRIWRECSLLIRQTDTVSSLALLIRALSEASRKGMSMMQQLPILEEVSLLAHTLNQKDTAYTCARLALDTLVQSEHKVPYDLSMFIQSFKYSWSTQQVMEHWHHIQGIMHTHSEAWLATQIVPSSAILTESKPDS